MTGQSRLTSAANESPVLDTSRLKAGIILFYVRFGRFGLSCCIRDAYRYMKYSCSTLLSIHPFFYCCFFPILGGRCLLEPIPAVKGREARYSLKRSLG